MAIMFIVGIIMVASYFSTSRDVQTVAGGLSAWGVVLTAFAILVSVVNGLRYQARIVMRRGERWPFFLLSIIVFFAYLIVGIALGPASGLYVSMFDVTTLIGTVGTFSMTAYSWMGIYRVMRVRNFGALIVLVFFFLVGLRQTPLIAAWSPQITAFGDWCFAVPNTAGVRAVQITIGLGLAILGIRVLLGQERGYLGEVAAPGA